MLISLKKQIHDKKISDIIKIHDIVLFFAIFTLPQKKRQYLKIKVSQNVMPPLRCSYSCFATKKNSEITLVGEENISNKKTIPYQLYISNKCAKQVLEKYVLQNLVRKTSIENGGQPIVLGGIESLPLHGQTLLVACRDEKQAQEVYKHTISLYKCSLLGGFYKNTAKNRQFLKAAMIAASNKDEIYKKNLRVLLSANYKLLKTTATSSSKLLVLLKQLPFC